MIVLVRLAEAAGALAVVGLVARSLILLIRYSVWRRRLRVKEAREQREEMRKEIEEEVRRELAQQKPQGAANDRSSDEAADRRSG
jgi:hypothetical protein